MKKVWQFLNTPLIVAIIAIALVIGLMRFSVGGIFAAFNGDETRQNEVEALGQLELLSFSEVDVTTNAPQKFVGEFKNHSSFIVQNVQGTVCFFNAKGELIDVLSQTLSGVGKVAPNQSCNFYIEREILRGDIFVGIPPSVEGEGVRSIINFVDIVVTKPVETSNRPTAGDLTKGDEEDPFQLTPDS